MLRIEGVSAAYGSHLVLRDIDLVVPPRSVVALLGPNGAGKTTLLRVASGLLRPTKGRVLLGHNDVTADPPHERAARGLCHIPEGRGVFTSLSVHDNLRLHAVAGADATSATVAFPRLRERAAQRAGTLSGGEQQMLALARAYVAEPAVVLADEVSMGLSPAVVDEVYEHLRALASTGAALLLVEQYVSRALDLAEYVYILGKGRIVFAGEPGELRGSALADSYFGGSGG